MAASLRVLAVVLVLVPCGIALAAACSSNDTTASGSDGGGADASSDVSSATDGAEADTTPVDADRGDGGVLDAGFGQYMGPCGTTQDCPDGGTCFNFPQFGKYCTLSCGGPDGGACPAPSPHCSPAGVCALPR